MNFVGRYICLITILLLIVAGVNAQVTETASAAATIVTPMGIIKEVDMNFGNIGAGAAPGIVILTPEGTRQNSGGVTLPSVVGTVSAATFKIIGEPDFTYYISLSPSDLTISSGSDDMVVNVFASDPQISGTLGPNGEQVLKVGASLNIGALQPQGHYISDNPFSVTVNYN